MLNSVAEMGRLVKDPELRYTQNGVAVATFTIAVERDFAAGDSKKETDFFDVVVWRQTAEFVANYFAKGKMAIVNGRLQSRTWTDKNEQKRKTVEIVAERVYFGESKKDTDRSGAPPRSDAYEPPQTDTSSGYGQTGFTDDDIPF